MRNQNTKTRKNTATISLPKPTRKKSNNGSTGAKAKASGTTRTTRTTRTGNVNQTTTKANTRKKETVKVTRKRNSTAAVSELKTVANKKRSAKTEKGKSRSGVQYHITAAQKLVFVIALILVIAFSCVYVATRVQTRTTRFGIAELKKKQIEEMKEKEELTKKISTYKRPEFIMKRASGQGMVKAKSSQIEWVK